MTRKHCGTFKWRRPITLGHGGILAQSTSLVSEKDSTVDGCIINIYCGCEHRFRRQSAVAAMSRLTQRQAAVRPKVTFRAASRLQRYPHHAVEGRAGGSNAPRRPWHSAIAFGAIALATARHHAGSPQRVCSNAQVAGVGEHSQIHESVLPWGGGYRRCDGHNRRNRSLRCGKWSKAGRFVTSCGSGPAERLRRRGRALALLKLWTLPARCPARR